MSKLPKFENMTLGETIRLIRVSRNIRSKDLAEALGITKTYYSQIENNMKPVSLILLRKVATYFELPLSKIFLLQENNI